MFCLGLCYVVEGDVVPYRNLTVIINFVGLYLDLGPLVHCLFVA